MNTNNVTIVELEPMWVASTRAVSESPEEAAWQKIQPWADAKGLLRDVNAHPVFGFNNPSPSDDHKEYGYEYWIKVNPDMSSDDVVTVKPFDGGLYAVMVCEVKGDPGQTIPAAWQRLADWVQNSSYEYGTHQWLEKCRNPGAPPEEMILELYCPIKLRA